MEKETTGTVISVTKQWWLKVNRKPVRTHAMDGAAFPHIIKVNILPQLSELVLIYRTGKIIHASILKH